jgi:putative tryptophan/tyrosine transport system substrate-binding protein
MMAKKILIEFIVLFASFYFWSMPLYAGIKKHVLIVTNMREEPYSETVRAFKKHFATNRNIQFTELSLSQVGLVNNRKLKPDLIFALGNEATKWASAQGYNTPVISSLDFSDNFFEKSKNITGVKMYYSLHTQVMWLKNIFRHIKKVGVLYNPRENAHLASHVKTLGQQAGLDIITLPVTAPRELPSALGRLRDKTEVLLAIPDKTIYSETSINEIFLFSFRNKLPLIGLADNWTRSGAIYSLSWDFVDLGRQCADLAAKVFNGTPVQSIAPEYPRKVAFTFNTKVAQRMNIDIPKKILSNAKMVF